MKTHPATSRISALLITATLVALVGCADREPAPPATPEATPSTTDKVSSAAGEAWDATKETASDVYTGVKNATTDTIARLDRATYDERASIRDGLADAADKLEAELAEWRAEGKATGDDAANSKLADAKATFKQRLQDLGEATADGWDAAKARAAAAWVDLKAAYAEAKGEPAA